MAVLTAIRSVVFVRAFRSIAQRDVRQIPLSKPAFEDMVFDKENFETWVDESGNTVLTDEQWEAVRDELDGRAENFFDEMIYNVVLDFREGHFDEQLR